MATKLKKYNQLPRGLQLEVRGPQGITIRRDLYAGEGPIYRFVAGCAEFHLTEKERQSIVALLQIAGRLP